MRLCKLKISCVCVLSTLAYCWPAAAHNGHVAIARPVAKYSIDGRLDEWADTESFDLLVGTDNVDAGSKSPVGQVQVATDTLRESLLVAITLRDDDRVHNDAASDACEAQDCVMIYLDRQHKPAGSGVAGFLVGGTAREIVQPLPEWDPANADLSWSDVQYAVAHEGDITTHEFKIPLGQFGGSNRTVGFDVFVQDYDAVDDSVTYATFGPGYGKSGNPYRLGDALILDSNTRVVNLTGSVAWHDTDTEEPLPERIRIQSGENTDVYVDVRIDDKSTFSATLPAADYSVCTSERLTKPFRVDFGNFPQQVSCATKSVGTHTTLTLATTAPNERLLQRTGILGKINSDEFAEIDAYVSELMQYYQIPGVSYAILQNGHAIHTATLGVGNSLTNMPLTEATLLEGASITKPMFAIAAMKLAKRGVIDLDKPLLAYLPFPNIEADERAQKMTARHVLTHQSGLPNWAFGGPGGWASGGNISLMFEPGEQFHYSGEGFDYLGRVLEKLDGRPLDQIMLEEVSVPYGLEVTRYALTLDESRGASIGHFQSYPVWRSRQQLVSPASSLHSNGPDFASFLVALIDPKFPDRQLLDEMFEPAIEIPPQSRIIDDGREQRLGIGFYMRDTPFGVAIEHGGNNDDFDSKFSVIPDIGAGYVMFTNSNVGDELIYAFEKLLLFGAGE